MNGNCNFEYVWNFINRVGHLPDVPSKQYLPDVPSKQFKNFFLILKDCSFSGEETTYSMFTSVYIGKNKNLELALDRVIFCDVFVNKVRTSVYAWGKKSLYSNFPTRVFELIESGRFSGLWT